MKINRIYLIVCDSMGIGNAKDAKKYNDFGANNVGHICSICDGLSIQTLQNLGFGNLGDFKGVAKTKNQKAYILKLNEASNGKDTMTRHWEMMGLKTEKPFITFTDTAAKSTDSFFYQANDFYNGTQNQVLHEQEFWLNLQLHTVLQYQHDKLIHTQQYKSD